MAGFQRDLGWVMAVAVALLLVAFVGLARNTSDIMFGAAADADDPPASVPAVDDRSWHGPRLPLLLALGVTAVIGFLAGPFATLLTQATAVIGGGR